MFDLKELPFWFRFRGARRYVKSLDDEVPDELLEALLSLMKLTFWFDPEYRRNIENFTGSYRFQNQAGGVNVLIKFDNGEMKFSSKDPTPKANVTVTFKDSQALLNFLLADFDDALRKFLQDDCRFWGDLWHADFGHALKDFMFAHGQALRNYLLAFKKDIIKVLIENQIHITGNLNYLYKFGFMANHPVRQLLNLANKFA